MALALPLRFEGEKVQLAGTDVSDLIRTEAAGLDASRVSVFPAVRAALLQFQRQFRQLPGLVADGRDMGTVVFPDAPLKVFLTASADKRAQRRYKQLISKGISVIMADLQADLKARDARDANRTSSPLVPARNSQLLDNSDLTIEQSVSQVIEWWQARANTVMMG
jgi:3-phosphoshikimate 1-carboxyvinyltransferase